MGTLTIGCFASLVGSKSLDFSLKLAKAALDKGHKVNIWLSSNATIMAKANQKHLKDYSHSEKYVRELLERGVEICECEACALARGIQKAETVEGVEWSAMHWYLAKIYNSDRVVHIGGE
ncbi:MAG: DsrE family protein [Thermodesulfovibrionales bacterium]|nr:DsrE family protein [Thermodesulfovibrionales bacterium]